MVTLSSRKKEQANDSQSTAEGSKKFCTSNISTRQAKTERELSSVMTSASCICFRMHDGQSSFIAYETLWSPWSWKANAGASVASVTL